MRTYETYPADKFYITSDTHFGHENIIRFSNRPFKNKYDMTLKLIDLWNSKVPQDAAVFHLGDFGFKLGLDDAVDILSKLNGQIHLIEGNHDHHLLGYPRFKDMFRTVRSYARIVVAESEWEFNDVILMHYPLERWDKSHYGSWHLYGHCHMEMKTDAETNRVHVGVDTNNYTPLSYWEIKEIMDRRAMNQMQMRGDRGED